MNRLAFVDRDDPRVAAELDALERGAVAFDAELAEADRRARENADAMTDFARAFAASPEPLPLVVVVTVGFVSEDGADVDPASLH